MAKTCRQVNTSELSASTHTHTKFDRHSKKIQGGGGDSGKYVRRVQVAQSNCTRETSWSSYTTRTHARRHFQICIYQGCILRGGINANV